MPSTTAEKLAKINRGELKLNNEFTNVRIILTDAHDESNKIVIDFSFNGTQEGSPDGVNENGGGSQILLLHSWADAPSLYGNYGKSRKTVYHIFPENGSRKTARDRRGFVKQLF